MIKVSVVIPTYSTAPDGLKRLVGSLDAQTLPSDEFEVIFVDDGSPDETLSRLHAIQATRPNVRVTQIENSGWASRPRNIGIEMAQGEYVIFMDHDDLLYPDALRAGYDLAHKSGSDVLSGKESRTNDPSWGYGVYNRDEAQALGRGELHPLVPTNPHKLYRRDFLMNHEIRFPEGRLVFWEDVLFNVRVARHAKVVSKLASVPFYHWVTTEGSGTTLFDKNTRHYWTMLRRVCEAINEDLGTPELRTQREQLLFVQYRARVLGAFNVGLVKRPAKARRMIFDEARRLRDDFDLARFDDKLSTSVRLRARLLGDGRLDLLERLCAEDVSIAGWTRAQQLEWRNGVLHIEADITWASAQGRAPALRTERGRILKKLSPGFTGVFTDDDLDMTADIAAAHATVTARDRETRIIWNLASETRLSRRSDEHGQTELTGTVTATLDPEREAFGEALESVHWDLQARVQLGTGVAHRNVASDIQATITIVNQSLHLVYPNDGGAATLIPRGHVEAVRRLTPVSVALNHAGQLEIVLAGKHDGRGAVETTVGVDLAPEVNAVSFASRPASLRVEDGRAFLTFDRTADVMRVRIGDRAGLRPQYWTLFTVPGDLDLRVGQIPKILSRSEADALYGTGASS